MNEEGWHCPLVPLVFANGNDARLYVLIERASEIRSEVVTQDANETCSNARCDPMYLQLSTCDWITKDAC